MRDCVVGWQETVTSTANSSSQLTPPLAVSERLPSGRLEIHSSQFEKDRPWGRGDLHSHSPPGAGPFILSMLALVFLSVELEAREFYVEKTTAENKRWQARTGSIAKNLKSESLGSRRGLSKAETTDWQPRPLRTGFWSAQNPVLANPGCPNQKPGFFQNPV